jgi:membrane protein
MASAGDIVQVTRAAIGVFKLVRRHPVSAALLTGVALVYGLRQQGRRAMRMAGPAHLTHRKTRERPDLEAEREDARHAEDHLNSRGREARTPEEIPGRGWRDIVARVKAEIGSDHVSLVAAGLAMYGLLAVFPGLAAAVSIYGMFASPTDVIEHMRTFSAILPPGTFDLFSQQLQTLASRGQGTLTIGALAGLAVALWGARAAMASMMTATNIAYAEVEKRGFIRQTLLSLLFTCAAIVGFLVMLAIGVVVPVALKVLGTSQWVQWIGGAVRWLALWAFAVVGLGLLYRYAPSRQRARWHWVTWGSAIAATLWILLSVGFAFYVGSFGTYGKTYGALGSVIALLMWFYLSSFVVVVGAEINAEMERQTRRDTTTGPEAPLGARGAYAADTVGASAAATKSPHQSELERDAPAISERGRREQPQSP